MNEHAPAQPEPNTKKAVHPGLRQSSRGPRLVRGYSRGMPPTEARTRAGLRATGDGGESVIRQEFGRLTVIGEGDKLAGHPAVKCRCSCGTEKIIQLRHLEANSIRSCGCLRRELRIKHGLAGTPEYKAWKSLIYRCSLPKDKNWLRYGGRGISVCSKWSESFQAFLDDVGPRPSIKHSIDRIDNNGNYEPGNCRWATRREQQRNKRNNIRINYNGEDRLLVEVIEELALNPNSVRASYRRNAVWFARTARFSDCGRW